MRGVGVEQEPEPRGVFNKQVAPEIKDGRRRDIERADLDRILEMRKERIAKVAEEYPRAGVPADEQFEIEFGGAGGAFAAAVGDHSSTRAGLCDSSTADRLDGGSAPKIIA